MTTKENEHFQSQIELKVIEAQLKDELVSVESYRNEGKKLKGKCGWLNEFLWTIAGADKELLRTCPCDYVSQAGIGMSLLSTFIFAVLSGGYAIYIVTSNFFMVIVISVIWGFLFYNLNRFILSTIYASSSVKERIISILPRIGIGVILGIIVAIPINLKVFEENINEAIKMEHVNKFLNSKEYTDLEHWIDYLSKQKSDLQKQLWSEIRGNKDMTGYGNSAARIVSAIDVVDSQISKATVDLRKLKEQSSYFNEEESSLKTRLKALVQISSFKNKGSFIIPTSVLLISLLFILAYILPILLKIQAHSHYESLLLREVELRKRIERCYGIYN